MVQLNEKLDDSCEIVEDSSLSYIVKSQINDNQNEIFIIIIKKKMKLFLIINYKV